jgi:hypothetical protein
LGSDASVLLIPARKQLYNAFLVAASLNHFLTVTTSFVFVDNYNVK